MSDGEGIENTREPRANDDEIIATMHRERRRLAKMTPAQRKLVVIVIGLNGKVATTTRGQLAADLRWNGLPHLAQECTGRTVPEGSVLVYSTRATPPKFLVVEATRP